MKTVAELLEDLFEARRRPDGRRYTNVEVCTRLGRAIEPAHLGKLRKGEIPNPKRDTLLALCRFFSVSPNYFFPELLPADGSVEPEPVDLLLLLTDQLALQPDTRQLLTEFLRALLYPQLEPARRGRGRRVVARR